MITVMNCKDPWKYKVAHTHWKQHSAGPCPFPLPSSHLPPFPPLFNPSLSLFFSLPSWIKSIIPACSPSEHFSAQLLWKLCVCVWTPCVCMLRRVLCVCIGLCVFLSGAGVQPFISWADCRQGILRSHCAVLQLTHRLLFGLFQDSLDFFVPEWDPVAALFLPSRHH